ncbi:glycosyltransferase family A protein [Gangjinia marincola]
MKNEGSNKSLSLEILIATMNRDSLDFLDDMFPHHSLDQLNLLIVNQTTPEIHLTSSRDNIRVINSLEKGLSKSRNLALIHAKGDVVLFADDDLSYVKDFKTIVLESYKNNPKTAFVTFKHKTFKGEFIKTYPTHNRKHTLTTIESISSREISCRLDRIKKQDLLFNEYFGLGSTFETGEEYLFVCNLVQKGYQGYFCNKVIVLHPAHSSGMEMGSDRVVYGKSALKYLRYKDWTYFWILKYVFFLVRNKYIKVNEFRPKLTIGMKGIKDVKNITS